MEYVALLRGINVGTVRRIDMGTLKGAFEAWGYAGISTYIHSGNVRFSAEGDPGDLRKAIETGFQETFGYAVPILVKTAAEMRTIAQAVPLDWATNDVQRSDVAYLFPEIDSPGTIDELPIRKELVDIRYVQGAICWNIERANYNRSHLNRIIGHPLYQLMTVRNVNTARVLAGGVRPGSKQEGGGR